MDAVEPEVILVVDDDVMVCEAVRSLLEEHGLLVDTAEDGGTARALLATREYAAVLLDLELPDTSGLQLLQEIRSRKKESQLPVILQTVTDRSETIVRALELGANDYVVKPYDLRILRARLQTHLKMRSLARTKDRFLGIASHDLKAPLTVIQGSISYLRGALRPGATVDPESYDLLKSMHTSCRQMHRIVEDFLGMHSLEAGHVSLRIGRVDLDEMIAEVLDSYRSIAHRKGVSLARDLAGRCLVEADVDRVRQVVVNLVDNAVKYTAPDSEVRVSTRRTGTEVLCEVADAGPGMRPVDLHRLIADGVRPEHRPTGGESSTGIGLSVAREMLRRHGSDLEVWPRETGGSIFGFRLAAVEQGNLKEVGHQA